MYSFGLQNGRMEAAWLLAVWRLILLLKQTARGEPSSGYVNISQDPAWRSPVEFEDSVRASPLIDESGNVFMWTCDGKVRKLSPDGRLLWNKKIDGSTCNTGALGGSKLYIHSSVGEVHALDQESGEFNWTSSYRNWAQYGNHVQTIFIEGEVLVTSVCQGCPPWPFGGDLTNTHVLALNATHGGELWRFKTDNPLARFRVCSPVDGTVVFQDRNCVLYRLQLETGKLLWRSGKREADYVYAISFSHPACSSDRVWSFSSNSGDPAQSSTSGLLTAYAMDDGHFLWEQFVPYSPGEVAFGPTGQSNRTTVIVTAAMYPGQTVLLPLATRISLWRKKLARAVLAFDGETGEPIWKFELQPLWRDSISGDSHRLARRIQKIIHGFPLVDHECAPDGCVTPVLGRDGTVYQGCVDALYALNDTNGDGLIDPEKEVQRHDFPDGFAGPPTLQRGMLAAAPCNGGLHVWKA